jgi:hypothetical protein
VMCSDRRRFSHAEQDPGGSEKGIGTNDPMFKQN